MLVNVLAGNSVALATIGTLVGDGISVGTLRKHFRAELHDGGMSARVWARSS